MEWERVRDIQAVESPRIEKNTMPALSQKEAINLLHAPDQSTAIGQRDFAVLLILFKTAAGVSAVANARVGDLEPTDTGYYLVVKEKGRKLQRKTLLEAALALLECIEAASIKDNLEGPLFQPLEKDRKSFQRKHLQR